MQWPHGSILKENKDKLIHNIGPRKSSWQVSSNSSQDSDDLDPEVANDNDWRLDHEEDLEASVYTFLKTYLRYVHNAGGAHVIIFVNAFAINMVTTMANLTTKYCFLCISKMTVMKLFLLKSHFFQREVN
jgi:hypothetical protein